MNNKPHTKEQAREFLKQEALNEINDNADFTQFQGHIFCVIAKNGLQLEAKKENLLSGDEWSNLAFKEILLKKVEQFLDAHIK